MPERVTLAMIEEGLLALGVKRGMTLEVHCSLSSFGYVEGGAHTVIYALQRAVGNDGAIVMPSFRLSPPVPLNSGDVELGIQSKIRILQKDDEKSSMGIVSDTFRGLSEATTGNGIFRVSAWGRDAEKHAASGFQKIIGAGGHALLLGVDIYSLSSMHYVEDCMPEIIKEKFKPSESAKKRYPESEWAVESWIPAVKPWYAIQRRAYEKGYITDCMIGESKCMLFQVKMVIELYREALLNAPLKLYGLE